MTTNDPISDFLTRIRNAGMAKRRFVDVDWSKMKQNIATILKDQGFIDDFIVKHDTPQRGVIRVFIKYKQDRNPVIRGLKRISKPGLRRYVGYSDIPHFFGGFGLSIVSTSQGVMAGREANRRKIGGELLCMVW